MMRTSPSGITVSVSALILAICLPCTAQPRFLRTWLRKRDGDHLLQQGGHGGVQEAPRNQEVGIKEKVFWQDCNNTTKAKKKRRRRKKRKKKAKVIRLRCAADAPGAHPVRPERQQTSWLSGYALMTQRFLAWQWLRLVSQPGGHGAGPYQTRRQS